MDQYTIYLVNKSADAMLFWCFLAPPAELASDPGVFANSSANLQVMPMDQALNYFGIPVQYVVGAGASNQAVGPGIQVVSDISQNANLRDQWDATYATVPPNEGPMLMRDSTESPANSIAIKTNNFNKAQNEKNGWFGNQSFGIMTYAGFSGMTWSPNPGQTRTLTPELRFYVAIGAFNQNSLAAWTDISNQAATVSVPNDFQYSECTVTYSVDGTWAVTRGKPSSVVAAAGELGALADLDARGLAADQMDTLVSVHWQEETSGQDGTHLVGTITVTQALFAAFTYFVLSGIFFNIAQNAQGQTTVHFTYSGDGSANEIKSLFRVGAMLLFKGAVSA